MNETNGRLWAMPELRITVDESTMRAVGALPRDPHHGTLARPNILMFNDDSWNREITDGQERRFSQWLAGRKGARLVVIELGAGTAVPSVRLTSERLASRRDARLIRINLREPGVPAGQIGLANGTLAALTKIKELI